MTQRSKSTPYYQSGNEGAIFEGSTAVHRIPPGMDDYENYHFPISHLQVRTLLGRLLTQAECMNLSEKSEAANKAVITQLIWRWFDEVMENSATSFPPAGLLPIKNLSREQMQQIIKGGE